MKRYVRGIFSGGQMRFDFMQLTQQAESLLKEGEEFLLSIEKAKRWKTLKQLRAFHGPVCEQVQRYWRDEHGEWKSLDRVKEELKDEFLVKKKQYYDDGSPVLLKLPHPSHKNAVYLWHLEQTPSLKDLSIEEMTDFIEQIINHYWHEKGWQITIEDEL